MSTATSRVKPLDNQLNHKAPESAVLSWLCLLFAAVLLLFADGRNTIPLAAWLAPALMLRFVRTQPAWRGVPVAYLVMIVFRAVAMRGMIPIPGVFYYIFLVISGVSALLPYLADRLVAPRLKGMFNTLVFPCTLVAAQFIYSHGPVGSWGSIPYTQSGNLPLLQILSVTGLWGITFLIGWFAAVVNRTFELEVGDRRARLPLLLFSWVYVAVILLGGARLVLSAPSGPTVRIASLSPAKDGAKISDELLQAVVHEKASQDQVANLRSATNAGANELLARSEREAIAGAKIIFWSETAAYILKEDEAGLFGRGGALAAKHHVYLGMTLGTWTPGATFPLENKLVLIEPTGAIAWQYLKARPTPGPEAAMSAKPDGLLRHVDTPFGRLAAAICYDMDFPKLMAQAGEQRAELVLSPAGDWQAIDPRHTEIASFRAIEQGFNLVRQSNGGLSAAYDFQGRRLAAMDQYQAADLTMIAEVPTRGTRTI
ncbi:MAG: nitrilase-related carbon-nitrogen hydrolase, partial [Alloacidobacterium sp.]